MGSRTRQYETRLYLSITSVNLFFPPDVNKGDLHNIHMLAWAKEYENSLLFTK